LKGKGAGKPQVSWRGISFCRPAPSQSDRCGPAGRRRCSAPDAAAFGANRLNAYLLISAAWTPSLRPPGFGNGDAPEAFASQRAASKNRRIDQGVGDHAAPDNAAWKPNVPDRNRVAVLHDTGLWMHLSRVSAPARPARCDEVDAVGPLLKSGLDRAARQPAWLPLTHDYPDVVSLRFQHGCGTLHRVRYIVSGPHTDRGTRHAVDRTQRAGQAVELDRRCGGSVPPLAPQIAVRGGGPCHGGRGDEPAGHHGENACDQSRWTPAERAGTCHGDHPTVPRSATSGSVAHGRSAPPLPPCGRGWRTVHAGTRRTPGGKAARAAAGAPAATAQAPSSRVRPSVSVERGGGLLP
jgi:hypothetical protein